MEKIIVTGTFEKKAERDAAVKSAVFNALGLNEVEGLAKIGSSNYVIPVEYNGETIYCGIDLTAKNPKATEKTPAFDVDAAVAKYEEHVAEMTAKAAARAAAKAEKLAKAAKAEA